MLTEYQEEGKSLKLLSSVKTRREKTQNLKGRSRLRSHNAGQSERFPRGYCYCVASDCHSLFVLMSLHCEERIVKRKIKMTL